MATTPYPFVSGAVLLASELNSTFNIPTSTKTDSYTLVAADAGKRIIMNKATATTITVNTSLFSASDVVEILNIGAGTCTITAGTATVSTTGSLALAQNGSGRLIFTSASASFFEAGDVTVAAPSSALTLVASATLTGSAVNITSCFSATYDNYLVSISNLKLSSSAGYVTFQLLDGSTTITTNYGAYLIYYKNGVNTGGEDPASSSWSESVYQNSASGSMAIQAQILQPFLAAPTWWNVSCDIQGNFGRTYNGRNTNATSYNGLRIAQANSFDSGVVRIYGYALS